MSGNNNNKEFDELAYVAALVLLCVAAGIYLLLKID